MASSALGSGPWLRSSKAKPQKASGVPLRRQAPANPAKALASEAKRWPPLLTTCSAWPRPSRKHSWRRAGLVPERAGCGQRGEPVARAGAEFERQADRCRGRRAGRQRAQAGGQSPVRRVAGAARRSCRSPPAPAGAARRAPACRRRCAAEPPGGRCAAAARGPADVRGTRWRSRRQRHRRPPARRRGRPRPDRAARSRRRRGCRGRRPGQLRRRADGRCGRR